MDDRFYQSLTTRERECLRLVGLGLTSRQIADSLSIRPLTVDGYVADARAKLEIPSRKSAGRAILDFEARHTPEQLRGILGCSLGVDPTRFFNELEAARSLIDRGSVKEERIAFQFNDPATMTDEALPGSNADAQGYLIQLTLWAALTALLLLILSNLRSLVDFFAWLSAIFQNH